MRSQLFLVPVLLAAWATAAAAERNVPTIPPAGQPIRVIIDTDCAAEVDDHFAVALAVMAPERFLIEGFVAAHFGDPGGPDGIERSMAALETVMDRAGMPGRYPIKRGSHPLRYSQVAEPSEGVEFIIERAMASKPDDPLWLVCLGPCTDAAAAYLKEPRIKDRIVVFWHGRTNWPKKATNFNTYNDVKAARLVFASELPLVLFDTGTNLTCPVEESERTIRPRGPLGRYLHEIRLTTPWFRSPTKGFFDLGDIAFLLDPTVAEQQIVPAPAIKRDLTYDHQDARGRMLRVFDIDRDQTFALLRNKLAEAYPD